MTMQLKSVVLEQRMGNERPFYPPISILFGCSASKMIRAEHSLAVRSLKY